MKWLFETYIKWRVKGMIADVGYGYLRNWGYHPRIASVCGEAVFSPAIYFPNQIWLNIVDCPKTGGRIIGSIDSIDD